VTAPPGTISFPGGTTSRVVESGADVDGGALLARLGLPPPVGALIVNGTTAPLSVDLDGLDDVLAEGVARVAVADRLTVVTGATDAGIFSLLGAAMVDATVPLVGVAPRQLVTWPGRVPDGAGPPEREREPLERHHSHFVLVDGREWGDETATMLALADALGRLAPTAAVLCGGGAVARNETLGHVRAGRPVFVLAGSGRLADDLAAAVDGARRADDPELAEMVERGDLIVLPLAGGPDRVAEAIRAVMAGRR
jgi:hypothetical protein